MDFDKVSQKFVLGYLFNALIIEIDVRYLRSI